VVIGIDEAGRGPVLGSLVYCAAFWPVSEHDAICKLGNATSLLLVVMSFRC
jgi:ribonuclease H2 subunit A